MDESPVTFYKIQNLIITMSNQFQRLIFLFFLTFILFSVDSLAQRTIQITVVDSTDHHIVFGANIKIDNSSKGIVSNID